MTKFKVAFVFALLLALLSGCGGGGTTSGAGASTSQNTSSSGTTSTSTTASTTQLPTGNGSFTGKVTTDLGHGLANVTITATAANSSRDSVHVRDASSNSISVTSNADGTFSLTGLAAGVTYNISFISSGYDTLQTSITLTADNPTLNVVIEAPKGSATLSFDMPQPLVMNSPVTTNGTSFSLSWSDSTNPGFVAYALFRSTQEGAGTTGTQIAAKLAPNDDTFVDTLTTPDQVTFYRVYEKDLIPQLGAFILVGSNEVSTTFPLVTADSPTGSGIALNTPLQITFSTAMNQANVQSVLSIVSDQEGDAAVTGQTSWSGNTMTFTPSPDWQPGRIYTVTLSSLLDANGDTISTPFTFTFQTDSGYVLDTTFGSSALAKIQTSRNSGSAISSYANPAISSDANGNIYVDGTNDPTQLAPQVEKFASDGSLLDALFGGASSGVFPSQGVGCDNDGNVYTTSRQFNTSTTWLLNKLDGDGNALIPPVTVNGTWFAVDPAAQVIYITDQKGGVTAYDSNLVQVGAGTYPTQFQDDTSGVAVDSLHRLCVSEFQTLSGPMNVPFVTVSVLDESTFGVINTINVPLASSSLVSTLGLAADSTGNLFVPTCTTTNCVILKYNSAGDLVTRIILPHVEIDGVTVDPLGRVYVVENAGGVLRFVPEQ